jgi:Spo0E like sporulation regulatory protein
VNEQKLQEEVERLRKLMYRFVDKNNSLTHPDVLVISQQIDKLLVRLQRERCKRTSEQMDSTGSKETDGEPHRVRRHFFFWVQAKWLSAVFSSFTGDAVQS